MPKPEKKPEVKKEEPPEDHTEQEIKRPMAVPPPTLEERVQALELRVDPIEKKTNRVYAYHFGRDSKD